MNQVRRSLMFSVGEKYATQAIGIISTLVLSRLLTPADFGLFTVGVSITMLIEVARDFGVGNYIVQEQHVSRPIVRSAFTLTLLLSLVAATLLLVAAAPLVAFYQSPGLGDLLVLLAINFLLLPFAMPSMTLLRRDLAFGTLAGINFVAAVTHLCVVITLALLGHGYMSLAWALLASSAARTAAALACRPCLWAFQPSFAQWRELLSFGGYSTATAVINVFHDALPQLIIGRNLGLSAVGLFSRAVTVCQLPDRLLINALASVALPALASHARQKGDLKQAYLLALTHMTALQWPMLLCLALLADPIVLLLLGDQWTTVAPLVRIMALASLALFPAFMTYPILVALGHVRDTLTASLYSLPPSIALIFAASYWNLTAVAAVQFVTAPLQVYVALSFIGRRMQLGWNEIARAVRASLVVALGATLGPAAAVVATGFRFDISIPAMLLALAGAAVGWALSLWMAGHPLFAELQGAAAMIRRTLVPRRTASGKPSASEPV